MLKLRRIERKIDMEELSIERKVEEGVGFVVDGHNYGRLDRLSLEELATMWQSLLSKLGSLEKLCDMLNI